MNADITRMNGGMAYIRQLPDRGIGPEEVLREAQKYCSLGMECQTAWSLASYLHLRA